MYSISKKIKEMIVLYNDTGTYALLAFLGAFLFIFVIIAIVMYVLLSLGLYKLAQNAGIENPWLAWIPIANFYILGKLVKKVNLGSLEIPSLEIVLPVASIATMVLANIPFIGWLINLAYLVLLIVTLHKLFKIYRPEQATLWTVLSVLLAGIGMPGILIFVMRNDSPKLQ